MIDRELITKVKHDPETNLWTQQTGSALSTVLAYTETIYFMDMVYFCYLIGDLHLTPPLLLYGDQHY